MLLLFAAPQLARAAEQLRAHTGARITGALCHIEPGRRDSGAAAPASAALLPCIHRTLCASMHTSDAAHPIHSCFSVCASVAQICLQTYLRPFAPFQTPFGCAGPLRHTRQPVWRVSARAALRASAWHVLGQPFSATAGAQERLCVACQPAGAGERSQQTIISPCSTHCC